MVDFTEWLTHHSEPEPNTGCYIWLGGRSPKGYGRIGNDSRLAHKFVYESVVSRVPDGLTLDHLCRNKACVNPRHLEPVSSAENCRRHYRATLFGRCRRGHKIEGDNVITERRPSKSDRPRCRECHRRNSREWKRGQRVRQMAIDPNLWASTPHANATAFLDLAGSVELWLRQLLDVIGRSTGKSVRMVPLGTPGGGEWLLALQKVFADASTAVGIAPPPDLTDYSLDQAEDFASFTFLLSQQGIALRKASGLS